MTFVPAIRTSSITTIDDEPRIRDVDLGFSLGMKNPQSAIRQMIVRNYDELTMHGNFPYRTENPGKLGGRPGKSYYLNEGQALVICALSRTEKAVEIRKQLIDVFRAYRAGTLQPAEPKPVKVVEHRRRLPVRALRNADISFLRLESYDCKTAEVTLKMPFATAVALVKAVAPV